jgi:hypothetical protein
VSDGFRSPCKDNIAAGALVAVRPWWWRRLLFEGAAVIVEKWQETVVLVSSGVFDVELGLKPIRHAVVIQ